MSQIIEQQQQQQQTRLDQLGWHLGITIQIYRDIDLLVDSHMDGPLATRPPPSMSTEFPRRRRST